MTVITGGKVIGGNNPGQALVKNRVYRAEGVPTDTNIGFEGTPPDLTLAENVLTGFVYERRTAVWTRIDT
ncbi:hypothetical protein [Tenggerimyces flavus]|uniref:Uncharacterized protein n=1 Tax=Tenggerimyces flavus TaxID=1708749 RepID=A0ABV7YEE5_9ACTN|nr:hypothetical protein [Tenggerimyces flavus]MBM7788859.1 hypothetical protein [Tenggerimyces flavus]